MNVETVFTEVTTIWPHNRLLTEDPAVEAAVLNALDGRITDSEEVANLVRHATAALSVRARLIPSDRRYTAMDLVEAMVHPRAMAGSCGLCLVNEPARRLWIPAGGSVVEIATCETCAERLDEEFVPAPVLR
ncbi:MAG: hypothetical protein JWM76_903 [Pseudonocardiales bacterium]|nr:hypothetical protein [Pseudonocardiales bacterium]